MAKATDIPASSRAIVHERDLACRVCGRADGVMEIHHIVLRSQDRNNHDPSNLVKLGGYGDHDCHGMVHAHPKVLTPALLAVVDKPWMTALQWLRWQGVDVRGLGHGNL